MRLCVITAAGSQPSFEALRLSSILESPLVAIGAQELRDPSLEKAADGVDIRLGRR
jgi:hypothetical protein